MWTCPGKRPWIWKPEYEYTFLLPLYGNMSALVLKGSDIAVCAQCQNGFANSNLAKVIFVQPECRAYHYECYVTAHRHKLHIRHQLMGGYRFLKEHPKVEDALLTAVYVDEVCALAPSMQYEQVTVGDRGEMTPATIRVDALHRWSPLLTTAAVPFAPSIPLEFWGEAYTVLETKWKKSWEFNVPALLRNWMKNVASMLPDGLTLYLVCADTWCHLVLRLKRTHKIVVPAGDAGLKFSDLADSRRSDIHCCALLRDDYVPDIHKKLDAYVELNTTRDQYLSVTLGKEPLYHRVTSRVNVHRTRGSECLLLVDRQAVTPDDAPYSYLFVGPEYQLYAVEPKPVLGVWPYWAKVKPQEAREVHVAVAHK